MDWFRLYSCMRKIAYSFMRTTESATRAPRLWHRHYPHWSLKARMG